MNNLVQLAFFGSSENSLTVLKALKEAGFNLKLVVTSPPRPVGRKQIITKTPPHAYAESQNLPVSKPEKLDQKFIENFRKIDLDVGIVADYAKLIPAQILSHPKHGFLNLHPSLLPQYRGSSPAEAAILNADKTTGMTIIKMDEKFDHGPIVSQFEEEIREPVYPEGIRGDTSETLYKRLFSEGAKVLVTILPAWIEGRIVPRDQNPSQASFAPRLTRDDGFLPWILLQKAIRNEPFQAKSLNPYLRKAYKSLNLESEGDPRNAAAKKISSGRARATNSRRAHGPGQRPGRTNINEEIREMHPLSSSEFPLPQREATTQPQFVERAIRAFHPWPGIWTIVPTSKGEKRLKILSAHLENNKLILDQVQLEGQSASTFNQLKSSLLPA